MTWRRRATSRLAAVAVVVFVAACSPADPSPSGPAASATPATAASPGASSSASAAPSPAARTPVQPARWGDCGGGFLCARVPVPSDYDNPAAGYLNVSMVQLPATDRASRIGSLFVNPGGPGASGVEFVRDAAASNLFPANLRKRFDIIGFDPRGVNSSTAIRCIDNLDGQAALDPSPDDAAELRGAGRFGQGLRRRVREAE